MNESNENQGDLEQLRDQCKGQGMLKLATTFEKWILGIVAGVIVAFSLVAFSMMIALHSRLSALEAVVQRGMPPAHYEKYVDQRFKGLEDKIDRVLDAVEQGD